VNVPWKIQEQLEESLPFIVKCLDVESSGGFDIKKY
jgi:23S rRNA A2030 N6-methylase RlmJ